MRNLSSLVLLFSLLCACGGLPGLGGGGSGGTPEEELDDPLQAANVSISADPGSLGLGDRSLVSVAISEVNTTGVILKIRYTGTLRYVERSAAINLSESSTAVEPFSGPNGARTTYMAFYFPRSSFDADRSGRLTFQLRAMSTETTNTTMVEVDTDVHDPRKRVSEEYNSEKPLFSAEDHVSLTIEQ